MTFYSRTRLHFSQTLYACQFISFIMYSHLVIQVIANDAGKDGFILETIYYLCY